MEGHIMTQLIDVDAFVERLAAATCQAGFVVEGSDGPVLQIIVHGQSMRCDLSIAYSAYQHSPARLEDVVESHLAALRSVPPPPPMPTEKEAVESLLPLLNSVDVLRGVEQQGLLPLASRPFAGRLVVTYVFDMPQVRAYINEALLARMTSGPEMTFDLFHDLALENLRRRTSSKDYQAYGFAEKTLIVCETGDGFAATRVLLSDLMSTWSDRIPGRMLIGIPNRDFLIAFSDRDPEHIALIAHQVRIDADKREGPLSAELFVWKNGRIRQYQPYH